MELWTKENDLNNKLNMKRMENREWQLGPATGVGWVRSRVLKWAW